MRHTGRCHSRVATCHPWADVRMVPDSKMDELATIEFVPPKGIEPWQGSVLLSERFDSHHGCRVGVRAGCQGRDHVDGRRRADHPPRSEIRPARCRHKGIGRADARLQGRVETRNVQRQLWQGVEPGLDAGARWHRQIGLVETVAAGKCTSRRGRDEVRRVRGRRVFHLRRRVVHHCVARSLPWQSARLDFAALVSFIAAHFVYSVLLPARSATGSALALRAESFRRFLAASEGKHVDWAWKQGLLREYSAWAVALGAADAWGRALATSNVPVPEMSLASPMWLYSMGPSFEMTRSAPSSSGSSGSGFGGFSGGSVGGGGGGGSSGSW